MEDHAESSDPVRRCRALNVYDPEECASLEPDVAPGADVTMTFASEKSPALDSSTTVCAPSAFAPIVQPTQR